VPKIKRIQIETQVVRGYFNNHYGAKAIVNALEFKELMGESLSTEQRRVLEHAKDYLIKQAVQHKFEPFKSINRLG